METLTLSRIQFTLALSFHYISTMSNRFAQRGGCWVAGQFMLLLVVAVLDVVCREESKQLLLFLCGLVFLTALRSAAMPARWPWVET